MSKKITASNVKLKRAYERPAAGDGTRILIDRLWPRGVKKVNAAIDQWAKNIAPKHHVAEMVRPRPCPLAGISQPLRGGGLRAP